MEIKQVDQKERGFFIARIDGKDAGLMTYAHVESGVFLINHTEVNKVFSGQGVGKSMVMAAVQYARENELKIIPRCPFARSVFDRVPEISDVLYL